MHNVIKTVLYEWKEREIPNIRQREYAFNIEKILLSTPKKVPVITGLRRAGKTFILFQVINKLLVSYSRKEVIYINFEDERIPQKTEFLTALIPAITKTFSNTPKFLFLDEIQNIPGWSKWLRRIIDTENFSIAVTGSSSKLSSVEIPTELRGRQIEIETLPLSFREFLTFKDFQASDDSLEYLANRKANMLRLHEEFLIYGGLPEVVLTDSSLKNELIQNYYKTIVSRDIIERHKVRNEPAMNDALKLLLNSTYFSVNKLYNTLRSMGHKIGKTTLLNYISFVEKSFFLRTTLFFSYKAKEQLQYPRKIFFIDNGFVSALSLKFTKDLGHKLENQVYLELVRKFKTDTNTEILYWKDYNGSEVDFVVKTGSDVQCLIQSCYDPSDLETKEREVKALLKASKTLKCKHLIVITEDCESQESYSGQDIRFIPFWRFSQPSNPL